MVRPMLSTGVLSVKMWPPRFVRVLRAQNPRAASRKNPGRVASQDAFSAATRAGTNFAALKVPYADAMSKPFAQK